jgi:AcrR family transcriptional regulator
VEFEPLTPERRRAMTREHLLEAAAIVFARAGFSGATLDEIAATAGFTKGAVYSNFKSKDDLFLALVDHRIERQFALVVEVLDTSTHEPGELLSRMHDLMRTRAFFFLDETLSTLYLEFVLYARRNPEARAKLAAIGERSRAFTQELIERNYAIHGMSPPHPPRELAQIAMALFMGFEVDRLVDPASVTDRTIDTALVILSGLMGVDGGEGPADP